VTNSCNVIMDENHFRKFHILNFLDNYAKNRLDCEVAIFFILSEEIMNNLSLNKSSISSCLNLTTQI
jgi:hypothetical protein